MTRVYSVLALLLTRWTIWDRRLGLSYLAIFLASTGGFIWICWKLFARDLVYTVRANGHCLYYEPFREGFRAFAAILPAVVAGGLVAALFAGQMRSGRKWAG